jgi:hypothetical protein
VIYRDIVVAAAALSLACSAIPAHAGRIVIEPKGDDFTVSVAIKNELFATLTPLQKAPDGTFSFDFDASAFADSAYAFRVIVINWKRNADNKPVTGVRDFELEIPVILRKWHVNDIYRIPAWSFDGIGERKLSEYEGLLNPEDQWRKLFASLQQADHYSHRVRPTAPETRRAYSTAIKALTEIAKGYDVKWLRPPAALDDRLREAFEREPKKRDSLLVAVGEIEGLLWADLNGIETRLGDLTCKAAGETFDYLDRRRAEDTEAYKRQVGDSLKLLDSKREVVVSRACGTVKP